MSRLFICLLLLFYLNGCQNQNPSPKVTPTSFTGHAMTIGYKILVGDSLDTQKTQEVQQVIQSVFEEVNAIYNDWNQESEISLLNRLPANEKRPLSPELTALLEKIDEIVKLTQGYFDPTIKPLEELWKAHLEKGMIPEQTAVAQVSESVGWGKIHIQNGLFYKDHDLTSLDLGGIAKGYAVDLLVERLNFSGYPNVYVEWGGEIRTSGNHPEGRPWKVFISRLGNQDPTLAIAHLDISNKAIATSGDYMQFWKTSQQDGAESTTYFHILHPTLKQPLVSTDNSIASASVIAHHCFFADALATAAMVFQTPDEAKKWAEKIQSQHPEVLFFFATKLD